MGYKEKILPTPPKTDDANLRYLKKIKVMSFGDDNIWLKIWFKKSNIIKILQSQMDIKIVEENEDLILTENYSYTIGGIGKKYKKQKVLVLSEENYYYTAYSPTLISRILAKTNVLKLLKFMKYKYKTKPTKITHHIINKNLKNKNHFFILPNEIEKNNVFRQPFFFSTHWGKLQNFIEIKKQKLYTQKKKFCAFLVSNQNCSDRIEFFQKLSKYKKIDSMGNYLKNTELPLDLLKKYKQPADGKYFHFDFSLFNQELFRDYKFVICFENSFSESYITEKLPNVMMANSIGIYRGASNVGKFFNTKSFINYDDYGSHEAMMEKIIELDQDDEKYQKMLEEPFFVNNELPSCIKNFEEDLMNFIDKIWES